MENHHFIPFPGVLLPPLKYSPAGNPWKSKYRLLIRCEVSIKPIKDILKLLLMVATGIVKQSLP